MKKLSFLLLMLLAYLTNAQNEADFKITPSFTPDFIEFSGDDKYLVLENETQYEVWNTETNSKVLSGKHRYKIGRFISGFNISEGSGYFLFGNEELFLSVDYTLNFTEVKAYDLTTGEVVWTSENLDMGISDLEIAAQILNTGRTVDASAVKLNTKSHMNYNYFTKDHMLDKLVSYMPDRSAISVNGKNGLQLVDLKTGDVLWNQPELKGSLGELFYDEKNDFLIAVRLSNSELDALFAKPEVQALHADTGDLIWQIEYDGEFKPNAAYVVDETLVLPFYGLTLINIKTGEELEGDVKESMESSRKMARRMAALGSTGLGGNGSYPILDEKDVIHYFTGFRKGKDLDPDGGKKAYLQIDIHKDKFILVEEDLAKTGNRVIQEELTNNMFYVKLTKGLSNTYILALDRNSGKVVFETDKIKNRFGSEYDPFLLDGNRIVDVSAKGIFIYDAKTGKEIKEISHKDIGVGRLRNQVIFDNGLILFGTKGVSIVDDAGNVQQNFEDFSKIRDYRIGDEIWLVEKKRFTRIDASSFEILEDIEFKRKENVFFSPSGNYFIKLNEDGNAISMYCI